MTVDTGISVDEVLARHHCSGYSSSHHEDMQAIQPAVTNEINSLRRGDIPMVHECDDKGYFYFLFNSIIMLRYLHLIFLLIFNYSIS